VVEAGSIEAFDDFIQIINVQGYGKKAGEWQQVMMLAWRLGTDMMGQMASSVPILRARVPLTPFAFLQHQQSLFT